jgi:cytochrome c6
LNPATERLCGALQQAGCGREGNVRMHFPGLQDGSKKGDRELMKKVFAFAVVATMAMPLVAADGAAIFKAKCKGCHGADGTKTMAAMGIKPINSDAVKSKGAATLTAEVTNGVNKMPAFKSKLSGDEINAVVQYVLSLK